MPMTCWRGYFALSKAFIAQLHAGLVLAAWPVGAVTREAGRQPRQFVLHFEMTMYGRHKAPVGDEARKTPN